MSLREQERVRVRAQLNTAQQVQERARQRHERRARQRQEMRAQRKPETEAERTERLRQAREQRAHFRQQAAQSGALVVYPFEEWCVLRSLSKPQGRRIIAEGRVKVTWLSE